MSYSNLRKGRFSVQNGEYFITTIVYRRRPLFHDFQMARRYIRLMHELEAGSDHKWLAWIVMPDHFHGLLRVGSEELSATMNRLKGFTAHQLNREFGLDGQFWQQGFHDRALRKEDDRKQLARYLIANPLRSGLVNSIGEYPHWDSVWL